MTGLVATSEMTLEINLIDPLPIYPALLTDLRGAVAIPIKSSGKEEVELVGTGPFQIESIEPYSVQLKRNEGYWKDRSAFLDKIDFRLGINTADVAESFRSGAFDLTRDVLPQDLEDILRDRHRITTYVEAPQKNIYYLVFNQFSTLSKIPELRQALAGAMRIQDLVPSTLGRFAQAAQGLLPPGILGHDPGRRSNAMTQEQVKELIRSTGLQLPIRLQASVHPIYQDRYSSFTSALFKAWSDIGVEIVIKTHDMASYNDTWTNNEGIDLLIGRWFADYDDPDNFTYVLFHTEIGHIRSYNSSKELDHQMEAARLERKPEAREKLYRQLEHDLTHSAIFVPLFHDIDYRIANDSVRGLALSNIAPFVNYSEVSKAEVTERVPILKTERGTLAVPVSGSLMSLDPFLTVTYEQAEALGCIFETLTRASEGARIIPWLASSFEAEDRGKKFRFRLRDGIRFHDERRLTARDVRYSFERLLQYPGAGPRALLAPIRGATRILNGESKELEGFRILSALEFTIELEQPLSFFPAILAYTACSIIPEGTAQIGNSLSQGCIGTGPFRLSAFETGRKLALERYQGYWRSGYPKVESMEFHFEIPPAEILSGFKSGRYSLAWNLFPSDVESLRHEWEFAAKYREIPSLSTYYIAFNIHRGPLASEELRQAIVNEIDVEGLVERNVGRLALSARTLIPPTLLGYEAGHRVSRGSRNSGPIGQDLELKVAVHSVYEGLYAKAFEEILNSLKKLGFRIRLTDIKAEQTGQFSEEVDLGMMRWYADYPDSDTFVFGLLNSRTSVLGKMCGNPEIDQLIVKGRTETDPTVRHSINRQVEELIQKRSIMLPLFHEQAYCFARPEVDGLELNFFSPVVPYEKLTIRR